MSATAALVLQVYKTLYCFTILYCTRVPPMLKLVDPVAPETAGASRVRPLLEGRKVLAMSRVPGVEHALETGKQSA
jgi:hypothetical protein